MNIPQQFDLLPYHYNHGLFADHYLDEVLPTRPRWENLREDAAPVRDEVTRIFAAYVPSTDEAQTEAELIRPILTALGHTFEVQPRLQVPGNIHRPDYVLYRDRDAKNANKNKVLDKSLLQDRGLAVADAKYWDRPLDSRLKDSEGNQHPAFQIYWYVLHSGVDWGILTNGRRWRLVHRDTAERLDVYYEVDLPEIIRSSDPARFLYFYAFFRRAAFDSGPLGLAELLRASTDYAHAVGQSLKDQIYDALRHITQGFLDYAPNRLATEPETLQAIYDSALILLYRLIFILYAEARELLPLRESDQYRNTYSLQAIKRAIAREITAGHRMLPTSARIWPQLKELFAFIDRGEPPLQIATYNGGLFDPRKHPFLEQYVVGDHQLQQAIDKLSRVNGEFIDYRDLAVQHIGTIYEGLLEYHLSSLDAAIPDDARDTRMGWTIKTVNDKGERKSTGSYYTPDYIVKFIVDRTVGPALRASVDGKVSDAAKLQAVLDVNVLDPAMGSGHFLVGATEYIARFLVDLGVSPVGKTSEEADLAFWKRRVVQSCIYGVDLNPLAVELAKLSLWLTTVAKDRPLSFLDHHLRPGNSLVGARLEHLAPHVGEAKPDRRVRKTEQAQANGQTSLFDDSAFTQRVKLAVSNMWLIERSEALSVGDVKQQEQTYDDLRRHFIARYLRLLNLSTASAFGVTVEAKYWPALVKYAANGNGASFPAFDELLRQADTIAARERFFHWELEFPEIFFDDIGRPRGDDGGFDVVIGNPPYVRQEQLTPYKPIFAAEYPEVYHGVGDLFIYFFAQGLRLVRNNGSLSFISSNSWLRANYATELRHLLRTTTTVDLLVDLGDNHVFAGAPDVYPAINIVRKVLPPTEQLARAAVFTRGEGTQEFEARVDAKLFPVAIHDQPDTGWQLSAQTTRTLFAKLCGAGHPLGEVVKGQLFRGVLTGLNEAFIVDQATRDRLVANTQDSCATPSNQERAKDINPDYEGRMFYGVKTGLNEAFIIDQATRDRLVTGNPACTPLLKKILRGEDLRPWYQEDEGRWIIALPSGWTRMRFGNDLSEDEAWAALSSNYSSISEHLLPFKAAGQKRYDKGDYWWELRACDYYAAFDQPKIIWPDIARLPRFSWDDSGYYLGNTGYILVAEPWYLGYLASRCAWFLISQISTPLGERTGALRYRLIDQYMRQVPIPDATPTDREAIAALAMTITGLARARYALHQRVRHRLRTDFVVSLRRQTATPAPSAALNQKLTAWWELDFADLRTEVNKVFKHDIPFAQRDDCEVWHAANRAEHDRLTADIIRHETELNDRVYALFALTPDDIAVIEDSTKYRYGEV